MNAKVGLNPSSYIYEVNPSGAVIYTFGSAAPASPPAGTPSGNGVSLSQGQGHGIAVVNLTTIYYTIESPNSNAVYSYTISPPHDNGALFTVSLALNGLSSIAYDGTNLWVADALTNKAYEYSVTGTWIKTVTLANAHGGFYLAYFTGQGGQGRLIANRGENSNIYDVYDLNGNVVSAAFITAASDSNALPQTNGIAYDGSNFLVANVANVSIDTYSGTAGGSTPTQIELINSSPSDAIPTPEGLSVNTNTLLAAGASVPTLSQWGLIICGMLLLAAGILMSRQSAEA